MTPPSSTIFEILDATWPAHRLIKQGPFTLRQGKGGGKRVSAASLNDVFNESDIENAEETMGRLSQTPLFSLRPQDRELDRHLEQRGYDVVDPCNIYGISSAMLAEVTPPRVSMFEIWEPLEIQKDIWATGGIQKARLAIMTRAIEPKTSILMRWDNHPAGTAFVGIYEGVAMAHAIEVLEHQRGKGVATMAMHQIGCWALKHGAPEVQVICTKENKAANALYTSLGMTVVGEYQYRMKGI